MNPSDRLPPSEIERHLHDCDEFLDDLFPQSLNDIREARTMFGTTPVALPERLREPDAVVARIVESGDAQQGATAFGQLITMLRTEARLSRSQLANATELDEDDLRQIECGSANSASPFAVTALAEYFRLQPRYLMRAAGLTQESGGDALEGVLSVAAYAKPAFDLLSDEEKALFREVVKQLRRKGEQ